MSLQQPSRNLSGDTATVFGDMGKTCSCFSIFRDANAELLTQRLVEAAGWTRSYTSAEAEDTKPRLTVQKSIRRFPVKYSQTRQARDRAILNHVSARTSSLAGHCVRAKLFCGANK